jgi:hypothetical protein
MVVVEGYLLLRVSENRWLMTDLYTNPEKRAHCHLEDEKTKILRSK